MVREKGALPLLGQYHVGQVLLEHDRYWMGLLFIYLTDKEKGQSSPELSFLFAEGKLFFF